MSEPPMPVVICGKKPEMAAAVKQALEPEFEVIHAILSLESGLHELPQILRGDIPQPLDDNTIPQLGTQNYTQGRTAAVVMGGGYDDEAIRSLREACKDVSNVPWLQQDHSNPGGLPVPGSPGYFERVVDGVKRTLKRLKDEGKSVRDGVYYY